MKRLAILLLTLGTMAISFTACGSAVTPTPATPTPASATPTPLAPAATPVTPLATPVPPAATLLPPTPTPDTSSLLYIESLRQRTYAGGEIEIVSTLEETPQFTRYLIAYPSDGLRITGYMNVPKGQGSFPVVMLNHGYFVPSQYATGSGTRAEADYLVERGYVIIASDYRNYAGSDRGESLFRVGYVYDVLNLVEAIKQLAFVNPEAIGMWGHSMGGEITMKALVVSPDIKAAVLVAPVSADEADVYWMVKESQHDDVGALDDLAWMEQTFGTPDQNPEAYASMSPIKTLGYVHAAVQIHHSEEDTHVPFAPSARLRDALLQEGKTVEFYSYPGQLHTFALASDQSRWLAVVERTLTFFDRYLKGQ